MKKILNICNILLLAGVAGYWTGCSEHSFDYSGPTFVLFADSIQTYPVWEDEEDYYEVVIGTTRAFADDRWVAVEIVDSESSAIEGVDYVLEGYNAKFHAGEYTTTVRIKADFDNIEDNEEKYVTLRLVADNDIVGQSYISSTKVILRRACKWTMDDLLEDGAHWLVYEYISGGTYRVIRAEKVDETRIRFKNFIGNGRDLVAKITDEGDFYAKKVEVLPQLLLNLEGYGMAYVKSVNSSVSYFYPAMTAMQLFLDVYVEGVGSFSVYPFTFVWASAEEAEYLIQSGNAVDNYN